MDRGVVVGGGGCRFSGRRPSGVPAARPPPRRRLHPLTRSCTLHLPGFSRHPEVIKHPTSAWAEADGLRTGHFLSGQSVSPRDQ